MINKKHLEKAILLSLLLTNVCRLGGGPRSIIAQIRIMGI